MEIKALSLAFLLATVQIAGYRSEKKRSANPQPSAAWRCIRFIVASIASAALITTTIGVVGEAFGYGAIFSPYATASRAILPFAWLALMLRWGRLLGLTAKTQAVAGSVLFLLEYGVTGIQEAHFWISGGYGQLPYSMWSKPRMILSDAVQFGSAIIAFAGYLHILKRRAESGGAQDSPSAGSPPASGPE